MKFLSVLILSLFISNCFGLIFQPDALRNIPIGYKKKYQASLF